MHVDLLWPGLNWNVNDVPTKLRGERGEEIPHDHQVRMTWRSDFGKRLMILVRSI